MRREAPSRRISTSAAELFTEVQRIFVDEMPAIYFVTPKVTLAVSYTGRQSAAGAAASATALERGHVARCRPASGRLRRAFVPAETSTVNSAFRRYFLRRLGFAVLLVFVVSSASLLLARLAPSDDAFATDRRLSRPNGIVSAWISRSRSNTPTGSPAASGLISASL